MRKLLRTLLALGLVVSMFAFVVPTTSAATTVTVTPDDMNGWTFFEEVASGSGDLVAGPPAPPLGSGSAELTVDATGRALLLTPDYAGVRLDEITSLSYSTYRSAGSAALAISLQFDVDTDLTDADATWQGRLVYEPYYTYAVNSNVWQTWDPMDNAGNGNWWFSGAPGNTACPIGNPCTWSEVLAAFPDAGIRDSVGNLILKAGGPWPSGFVGNVDAFTIGVNGVDTTYDFEPYAACSFTTSGSTMYLDSDCITDASILIPDGYTLDGNGYTITAVDPAGDHFRGAVVRNEGAEAHVTNLTVTADGLANACDAGDDRLRGIMFEGASGSITHSVVTGINQGPSGCQEGNAIEVRNDPFDGTHPDTKTVEIAHNTIEDYQKTGIVANGDVDVSVHHNDVGASATQENLAANSVQLGFGAQGSVKHNHIQGNQWMGTSDFAASAVLVYDASSAEVSQNNVRGNSDIGIFIVGDGGTFFNNRVFDEGADHPNSEYDIGLGSYGDNDVRNNKVRGFDTPYEGVTEGKNKAIPGPQNGSPWF